MKSILAKNFKFIVLTVQEINQFEFRVRTRASQEIEECKNNSSFFEKKGELKSIKSRKLEKIGKIDKIPKSNQKYSFTSVKVMLLFKTKLMSFLHYFYKIKH